MSFRLNERGELPPDGVDIGRNSDSLKRLHAPARTQGEISNEIAHPGVDVFRAFDHGYHLIEGFSELHVPSVIIGRMASGASGFGRTTRGMLHAFRPTFTALM